MLTRAGLKTYFFSPALIISPQKSENDGRFYLKRKILIIISIPFVSAILVFLLQVADIYFYPRTGEPPVSDAAIVLGAAAWGNNPSPVFRERLNHAIDLYRGGFCRYIIITGGKGYPTEPGESVIGRKYVIKNDVPENDIFIENYSRNTEQNLYYAKIIASKRDLKSFILVSDPYHLRRAAFIAEQNGMQCSVSATPTSRYRSAKQQISFLAKESYYMILYRIEYATGLRLM